MPRLLIAACLLALAGAAPAAEPEAVEPPPAEAAPIITAPLLLGQVASALPDDVLPGGPPLEVVLSLAIDDTGTVIDAAVVRTSGLPSLDEHALGLAPLLSFAPATVDGVPATVTIDFPFRFLPKSLPPPPPPTARFGGRVEIKGAKAPAGFMSLELYEATPNRPEPRRADHYDLGAAPTIVVDTGEDGRFAIPELPAGVYVVKLGGGAYRAAAFVEDLPDGADREVLYRVVPTGLDETVVIARRNDPTPERELTRDELWKMPGAGGDVAAAIASLPGVVVTTPDFSASPTSEQTPVVRGSASEDSVFALDGLPTPLLLHSLGQTAIVDNFVIDRAWLQPAAAEARFGDLTGAVVGIDIRAPRSDRIGGFVQPGLGQSSAAIEGPITPKSRFYIGFRRSYFDLLIRAILPETEGFEFATYPYYQDQIAKLQVDLLPQLKFGFDYIGGLDGIEILANAGEEEDVTEFTFSSKLQMHRFQGKLELDTGSGIRNLFQPALTFWTRAFEFGPILNISDRHTTLHVLDRLRIAPRPIPWFRAEAGLLLEVDGNRRRSRSGTFGREDTGPIVQLGDDDTLAGVEQRTRVWLGGWLSTTFEPIEAVQLSPEVRIDWFAATKRAVVQPRARAGFKPVRWLDLSLAGGRYVQSPSLDELNEITGNPDLVPEGAWHANLGVTVQPVDAFSVNVQGYYKGLDHQVVSSNGSDGLSDLGIGLAPTDPDDPTHGLSNDGQGRIWGAETLVRFGVTRGIGVNGWIAYSLAWAQRKDFAGEEWRWFQWDRRHQLTALLRLTLPGEISIGGRFQLQTGAPYTPVEDSIYFADYGFFVPQYGDVYSARRKPYHQLDLRLDKRFRNKNAIIDLFVDVTNVYYAKTDAFSIPSYDYRDEASFALIPAFDLGVRIEF